jgi:hypothetical protein
MGPLIWLLREGVLYYSGERTARQPDKWPIFNIWYPVGGFCNLATRPERPVLFENYMMKMKL